MMLTDVLIRLSFGGSVSFDFQPASSCLISDALNDEDEKNIIF
jgi:hypothetical protein